MSEHHISKLHTHSYLAHHKLKNDDDDTRKQGAVPAQQAVADGCHILAESLRKTGRRGSQALHRYATLLHAATRTYSMHSIGH